MNWAPLRSIQDDRWKFIEAPAPELYDLAADPHERVNLARREPARTGALRRALDSLSSGAGAMATAKPDREAIEKLAALGYVGVGAEVDHFARASSPDTQVPFDISRLSHPVIGLVGTLHGDQIGHRARGIHIGLLEESAPHRRRRGRTWSFI